MKRSSGSSKNSKKKVRSDYISFTGTSDENGRMKIDFSGPQVLVNGEPAQNVKLVRGYPRDGKGDKVISKIDYGASVPKMTGYMSQWSPNTAILDKFDLLLAVDTNTRIINGVWVSATVAWITASEWKTEYQSGSIALNLHSRFVELHEKIPFDPEGRGWYSVLNFGINTKRALEGEKLIGMVVDSKLGEHVDINARVLGYFSNYLLPSGVSLVYASDAMSDSIVNLMIKKCDKSAGEVLSSIEDGSIDLWGRWTPGGRSILMEIINPES